MGGALAPSPADEQRSESVTELTMELRRVVHAGSPLSSESESHLRDRCIHTAMKSMASLGGSLRLAGTDEHPVIEARFVGGAASESAARAAQLADDSVRKAAGNEFVAAAAAAVGTVMVGSTGVRVVFGAPEAISARLRENAAPGQILLGGASWSDSDEVEVRSAQSLALAPDAAPVPVFVLRDLR
jgi:hypothetical protein